MQTTNPYQTPNATSPVAAAAAAKLSVKQVLFGFSGRIPRSTYWLASLGLTAALIVILMALGFLTGMGAEAAPDGTPQEPGALFLIGVGIVYLVTIWSSIALQVKRWHDRGKAGVWVLINFVPIIGAFWALIECGFLRGTSGPNQFGPDPLS